MIRFRIFALALVLILGFGGVLFRAFQLQVLPTAQVARLAHRQLSKRIEIVGRRGSVKDRNGRELAVSVNSISVFANPKFVKNPTHAARVLSPVLGVPESVLKTKIQDSAERKFVWLGRQLNARQMALLEKIDLKNLPGIGILPEFRREYPQGSLAAHVMGFSSVDGTGIDGIEKQLDSHLRGDRNLVELKRDALGRPIFTHSEQIRLELNHGADVELTLDSNLQYVAEKSLREAVEKHAALGGSAIVLEPRTGEILALANYPTFDPNSPATSAPSVRRNRAITDPIEPGSVVKPFVVARAIEDKVVRPDSVLPAGNGSIRVGNKTIHEADAHHRFKTLTIADLIRVSSNVATVVLQQKMGWPRIESTYRKLGFGSATGIELGGESRGIFNTPSPKQYLEQATMAFGQGISTTPLQIAAAFGTIANGGIRVRPRLIRSVGGAADWEGEPHSAMDRVFTEATATRMRQILEKVVEGEGTGTAARVESFRVAGKTGTAQKVDYKRGGYERGAYWSSFAGIIPSQQPKFVVYVMIDHPQAGSGYGGTVAAPVFAQIARAALQLVPRDTPDPALTPLAKKGAPSPAPSAVKVAARSAPAVATEPVGLARMPDLSGLTLVQAMRLLQTSGLRLEFIGEGDRIAEQLPAAGVRLENERKAYLKLR